MLTGRLSKTSISYNGGYIALISVIIISFFLITITVALGFGSFFTRFTILDNESKEMSVGLAEACADRAILELAQNFSYTITPTINCSGGRIIQVDNRQCAICSIQATGPNENTIITQASTTVSSNNFSFTNLIIKVSTSTSDIQIKSWEEVAEF